MSSSTLIHTLMAECIKRIEDGRQPDVDGICVGHPEMKEVILRRLEQLKKMGLLDDPRLAREAMQAIDFPERLGEFRLIRRLGGGGMGVVYLAVQESLNREVALKIVRPEHLFFEGARDRFKREVDAVARLQHSGIVPIIAVGEEKGIPFFAMESLRGCSLSDILNELRRQHRAPAELQGSDLATVMRERVEAADESATQFGPSWVHACFRIVVQIAEALAHAHERGVIHRDLKPSNLMLTPGGRAVLLDFGLATLHGSAQLTRTGSMVGTPSYMAPEQIGAGKGEVDARTDVYGLGVVLYELLTLRPPYRESSTEMLMARIFEGNPDSVRRHNANVPWDAETVCLKAMDVDPARRYPSMTAFAADLRNVLELRPIVAARLSPVLRVRRYCQRHPARAMAIGIGLLLVAVGPLVWGVFAEQARRRVERERTRAEKNLDLSLQTIDEVLLTLLKPEFAESAQMDQIRRQVLPSAKSLLTSMPPESQQRSDVKARLVGVQAALAQLESQLGDPRAALAEYSAMEPIERALIAESPLDRRRTDDLLDLMTRRAHAHHELGEFDAADRDRAAAVAYAFELLKSEPERLTVLRLLMDLHLMEASREVEAARADPAIAALNRTLEVNRKVLALEGDAPRPDTLAMEVSLMNSSIAMLQRRGDFDAALALAELAVEKAEAMSARYPASLNCAEVRNDAQFALAGAQEALGDHEAAAGPMEEAVSELRESVQQWPDRPILRQRLCSALNRLAEIELGRKRPDSAIDALEESVGLLRDMYQANREVMSIASELAGGLGQLGDIEQLRGRLDDAEEHYAESIAVSEALLPGAEDSAYDLLNLAQTESEFARVLAQRGRKRESLEVFDRAVLRLLRVLAADAEFLAARDVLGRNRLAAAELELGSRDHRAAFARLGAVLSELAKDNVNATVGVRGLVGCIVAAQGEGSDADAERYAAAAMPLLAVVEDADCQQGRTTFAGGDLEPLRRTAAYRDFRAQR